MSFFSPLLSTHLSPFFTISSPLLSHSPFIKFNRNLKEDKQVKFPQSQPHSFSSSLSPPPPLPLQTVSPLYLRFILSSVFLHSSPRLSILSSNSLPRLSNSSVCAPTTPRLSLLLFLPLCLTPFHAIAARHSSTLWLSLSRDQFWVEMNTEKKDGVMWG